MKEFHEIMAEDRLICILRGIPEVVICDVLDSLYEGGIHLAEITYDTAGIVPEETTARMIERAVRHTEGRMYIGVTNGAFDHPGGRLLWDDPGGVVGYLG